MHNQTKSDKFYFSSWKIIENETEWFLKLSKNRIKGEAPSENEEAVFEIINFDNHSISLSCITEYCRDQKVLGWKLDTRYKPHQQLCGLGSLNFSTTQILEDMNSTFDYNKYALENIDTAKRGTSVDISLEKQKLEEIKIEECIIC